MMACERGDTQRAILDYLALKKRFCWRNNSGAFKTDRGGFYRMETPGAPDIICAIEGQFVGIEVKGEQGKRNRNQVAFKEQLEAAGGSTWWRAASMTCRKCGSEHSVRRSEPYQETRVLSVVQLRPIQQRFAS